MTLAIGRRFGAPLIALLVGLTLSLWAFGPANAYGTTRSVARATTEAPNLSGITGKQIKINLAFTGAVSGKLTSADVVCNWPVAASQHKFFFDVKGTLSGKSLLFTGTIVGYSTPKSYSASQSPAFLISDGGPPHIYAGIPSGRFTVGSGARSATLNVTVKSPIPGTSASVTIAGSFSCNGSTTA